MSNEIKSLAQLVQNAYIEAKTGKTPTDLMIYKSSGMNETTNVEGGYAVAAQMAGELMISAQQESLCYSKAKVINVTKGKSVKVPYVLETDHDSTPSNILAGYWPGEGGTKTESHPIIGQLDLPLNTLAVLVPITEELMEDVQQLEGWLKAFVPVKIGQELDARMTYGVPSSSMWGITSAGAIGVIGVANADPITLANMIAYEKALAPANKANAEWYMGTEQYNELLDLIDDTKTNTGYTWEEDGLYVFGHKVNVCEWMIKDEYDLILGDFSSYVVVQRGLEQVTSMSFKFNLDEMWIKWTIRVNGASFGNKITLEDGSIVAPFVIPAEGPVEMSTSSSSDSGESESSYSSDSFSSDSSESLSTEEQTSGSSWSLVSISSDSSPSTSSYSTSSATSMSLSSASSMSLSSSSSSIIESRSSGSSMSNSSSSKSISSSSSSVEYSSSTSSSSEIESRSSASSKSSGSTTSESTDG